LQRINSTRTAESVVIKQHKRQHISVQYSHKPIKVIHWRQHRFSVSEEQGRYIELDSRQSIGTSFAIHHAMLFLHGKRSSLARISSQESVSKRCINADKLNWYIAVKWFRTTMLLVVRNGGVGSVIDYVRALARLLQTQKM